MSKSAIIPAIRVEPALRQAVKSLLTENETLSGFVEEAVRIQVERRQEDDAFLKRALASRDKAIQTNTYRSADEVHSKLRKMLEEAKNKAEG